MNQRWGEDSLQLAGNQRTGLALGAKMHQDRDMNETIQQFLSDASGGASFREMGRVSGINHSTIRRQLTGEGDLTAPVVVGIARAYNANVIAALVAAGFITGSEAAGYMTGVKLEEASDKQLAQEILRRAMAGEAGADLTEPLGDDNVIVGSFGQNAATGDDLVIPENVEEEWAGQYAAHTKGDTPEDHTP